MRYKPIAVIAASLVGLGLAASTSQAALTLTALAETGANAGSIGFSGSTFVLNPNPGSYGSPQFTISADTGGNGSALPGAGAAVGWVNGGPWSYGPITTFGSFQVATVNTPGGTVTLEDKYGNIVNGTVSWAQIATTTGVGGTVGSGTVNVTGLSYVNGSQADQDLYDVGHAVNGVMSLSFTFSAGQSLTSLSTGPPSTDPAFSVSLTPGVLVPEPATTLAAALLLLPFGASTLRFVRKNRAA